MKNRQKSAPQRLLWAQFDALQMGSGWEEEDITKPQIFLEDVFGDSHPGSIHLGGLMEQAKYGVFEKGGFPAQYHTTDICDGCAQGHDGMNYILASREAICDMIEVHGSVYPWDGMILAASCDKSIPAQLKGGGPAGYSYDFYSRGKYAAGAGYDHISGGRGYFPAAEEEGCSYPLRKSGTISLPAVLPVVPVHFWELPALCSVWQRLLDWLFREVPLMPATMRDILGCARKAGRKIMELVERGIRVSQILTREAFENAVIVHSAIGGSTNATIHLPSIARELGILLEPELFDRINHQVPHLGNITPSGEHLTEAFWFAGGNSYGRTGIKGHAPSGCDDSYRKDPGRKSGGSGERELFPEKSGLSPQLRPGERTGDLPGGKSQGKGFCCHFKGKSGSQRGSDQVFSLHRSHAGTEGTCQGV